VSTTQSIGGYAAPSRLAAFFKALAVEAAALGEALLNPGQFVAEVEKMRALQLEANRIEASDPARAELLRRQAAHLCRG